MVSVLVSYNNLEQSQTTLTPSEVCFNSHVPDDLLMTRQKKGGGGGKNFKKYWYSTRVFQGFPVIPVISAGGASVCWADCPTASWKTVDFDVFWQMVTAGEFLLTYRTLVGLNPRMGPPVTRQLIWTWEPERRTEMFQNSTKANRERWRCVHRSQIWWP